MENKKRELTQEEFNNMSKEEKALLLLRNGTSPQLLDVNKNMEIVGRLYLENINNTEIVSLLVEEIDKKDLSIGNHKLEIQNLENKLLEVQAKLEAKNNNSLLENEELKKKLEDTQKSLNLLSSQNRNIIDELTKYKNLNAELEKNSRSAKKKTSSKK